MTENRKGSRWLRRIGVFIGILLLALLSLSFIVHIPAIQTWGVRQISTYISRKTESKVSVRRFDFNVFRHFQLKDFYLSPPGAPGDTLLYAKNLNVRFSRLWSLTRQKLYLKDIELSDAVLNVNRKYDNEMSDLTRVMSRLFNPDTTKVHKDARLLILADQLAANRLQVSYADEHHAAVYDFFIPGMVVDLEAVDFLQRELMINSVRITGPQARIKMSANDTRTSAPNVRTDTAKWSVTICELQVDDGMFGMSKPASDNQYEGINYADLELSELQLHLSDLWMQGLNMRTAINHMAATEQSGFSLSELSATELVVSEKRVELNDYRIATPFSTIQGGLSLMFDDIRNIDRFSQDVVLEARFDDARIWVFDLLQAIPGLQTSDFFAQNSTSHFLLDGNIYGPLDRLRGDGIRGGLGDIDFVGSFRSRNLTIAGEQILNLEIDRASFNSVALAETLPGVRLTPQFEKLGNMEFQGRFDGFFQDFVANGQLQSDLGSAVVDMRLNLKPGRTLAEYSGHLQLNAFDLEAWTGNPELGLVSFQAEIKEGRGLTPESANARLDGDIGTLIFKGYTYRNVRLSGLLDNNYFNGSMRVQNADIDVNFLGSVDFRPEIPAFDFNAVIAHLDLKALNITQDTNVIEGIFDITGSYKNLNEVFGTATVSSMRLMRSAREEYVLDTLQLDVEEFSDGNRRVVLFSDYGQGHVEGAFDLRSVYPQVMQMLHEGFPETIKPPVKIADSLAIVSDFKFDLVIGDSRSWLKLLGIENIRFSEAALRGVVDIENDQMTIAYYLPDFHIANFNFYRVDGELHVQQGVATNSSSIIALDHNEKFFFDDINLGFSGSDRNVDWYFDTDDLFASVNELNIRGTVQKDDRDRYQAHIEPIEMMLFDDPWQLDSGNLVIWSDDSIRVKDFVLSHQDESIALRSVKGRGLTLDVKGFDMHYLDQLWVYDKLDFGGGYQMTAKAQDIFDKTGISLWIEAPDFRINDTSFGVFSLAANMDSLGMPVDIQLKMDKPAAHIHADGAYYPPFREVDQSLRNSLDLGIALDTFPLDFLEFLLDGGINHTEGSLIGDVRLFGKMGEMDMSGELVTYEGATTVTYLGTRYRFHDQKIGVTGDFLDMTGATLTDAAGNVAQITGGLTHRNTKNLGLKARIRGENFTGLNTTKNDNNLYYGQGVGILDARFDGPLQRPVISVDATAKEGSHIYIAVDQDSDTQQQETFLRFVDKDTIGTLSTSPEQLQITGINFDMNLTMTPEAEVEIIFNERSEDIIKVVGTGNLQLDVTRTGEFTMYGAYEVEEGDYLFTNFVLNKPFEINRGGTLRWVGDPYEAQVNLEAEYTGIRTSLNTFLEEYLINASLTAKSEAGIKTPVELKMYLTGSLLEPEISFDIRFPQVQGELAGYADSKLRILQNNDNAMNEQVFGLLWAGTFLPSNVLQSDNTTELAGSGLYNTLSEFLSNQLSLFLSEVLEQAVADVDFISGIDFDVAYNKDYDFDLQNYSASEWELRLKNRLFDDRVILDVGGNYVTESPVAGTYFAGDYALEYVLTRDRRLKVRFYQRSERTIEGPKSRVGVGLSYRREFDSFKDWLQGLDKEARKLKTSSQEDNGPTQ